MSNRRLFASTLVAGIAALAFSASPALAQEDADEPIVKSAQIIDALQDKDVVLDRPGGRPPRSDARIDLRVQFTFGSAELRPQGRQQLDELAMAFNDKALVSSGFQLGGHTDMVGAADYNMRLSMQRANAVREYLIDAHGIAPQRLQAMGFGATRLADPSRPAAAVNRRVEVRRVAMMAEAPASRRPQPRVQPQYQPDEPAVVTVPRTGGGRIVPTPQ